VPFDERYDDVLEACKKIHAIHIQAGRSLARNIIAASIVSDEGERSVFSRQQSLELARHANIVTISSIGEAKILVPKEIIGRLIAS
jgi:hypothetical protein